MPRKRPGEWYHKNYSAYGCIIGYNYLAGHGEPPWPVVGSVTAQWISPQKTSDSNSHTPLITELNAWTKANMTFAPHGKRGPIHMGEDYSNEYLAGISSKEADAVGGNIGLLDGSVAWTHIEDMKIYRGSRMHDDQDCITMWQIKYRRFPIV